MRHSKVRAALLPAFALLVLLLAARTASACSCAGEREPCEAFGGASAVFVGTVTGVMTRERTGGEDDWAPRVFKFSVAQPYLGVAGAEIEVSTGMGGGDCGYGFRRGETYLVYAHLDAKGKRLITSICTRTRPIGDASEDLEFLRGLPSRAPGVTITGAVFRQTRRVRQGDSQPAGVLRDAALVIEGEGVRREARTDAEGRYAFAGLGPGAYKIRLVLPEELIEPRPEREVRVADRGCATVNYYVADNGRVGGRILDAEGRPAARVLVTLLEEGPHDIERDYTRLEQADEEGRFAFTGVPPGRYLIAVNLTRFPQAEDPTNAFPRTYYPGVARPEDAEVVKVGEGENVAVRELRLPPRRAESVVEGQVVWADGSPVAKAGISFRDVTYHDPRSNNGTQADEQGRFTIKGYAGQTLVIEARSDRPYTGDPRRDGPMERAEPVRITLANPTEPVKVTLKKLR